MYLSADFRNHLLTIVDPITIDKYRVSIVMDFGAQNLQGRGLSQPAGRPFQNPALPRRSGTAPLG